MVKSRAFRDERIWKAFVINKRTFVHSPSINKIQPKQRKEQILFESMKKYGPFVICSWAISIRDWMQLKHWWLSKTNISNVKHSHQRAHIKDLKSKITVDLVSNPNYDQSLIICTFLCFFSLFLYLSLCLSSVVVMHFSVYNSKPLSLKRLGRFNHSLEFNCAKWLWEHYCKTALYHWYFSFDLKNWLEFAISIPPLDSSE